jgi:aspartyl-tRNA(Asn)/glutamyl-tRNA(Gln) amidotransferase subunit A
MPASTDDNTQPLHATDALCFLPATDLAAKIRAREVSPVEAVDAVLERIEALNPRLNAFVFLHAEEARAQARAAEAAVLRGDHLGPLHGVPVSVKDNLAIAGKPLTSGSRLLRDNVARETAPIASRIMAAGGIIVGRTNTPEFAWRGSTDNRLFGETRNPWDLTKTAGGSSGGAGAAVAAGLAPIAHGTDGAGSIRIPASFCGIVGHKPSFGRVPFFPSSGANELAAHAGPMTRTVRDAALFLDVIAGPDERDRFSLPASSERYIESVEGGVDGWRVAWSPDLGHIPVDPEVLRIAEAAACAFVELGAHLDTPDLGLPDPEPLLDVLYPFVQAASHAARPADEHADMDPDLVAIAKRGARLTAVEVGKAMAARSAYWDRMSRAFAQFDVLVTPTISVPAFALGIVGPDSVNGTPVSHLAWTLAYSFNLTGQPAITVPCGFTSGGLPVGLQIVGRRHADGAVLRAAAAFESARPWADRRPLL